MIKFIADFLTFWIPFKSLKKRARISLRTIMFGYKVLTKAERVGKGLTIAGPVVVNSKTILGDNVHLNDMKISGNGRVTIGSHFFCGNELLIIAQNHNYEGTKIPYDETFIYKDIEIGDFVWIGSRVMILPGTKIGEGAIIQGGAVVHGEIPPYAIAGGNPAKVFKYRDIEHFKKLKAEGKFR